ncbi:MAG: hypothetical protein KKE16_06785 [Firmicutes bacterium]|nr:hypothetical protein [Bacillota bacterium]
MRILLTGFEPFGGRTTNASLELLHNFVSKEYEIEKEVLPVVYNRSVYLRIFEKHQEVDLIVIMGEAGNRTKVSLEKVALNIMSAKIPDNSGLMMSGESILENEELAYASKFDLEGIVSNLRSPKLEVTYHAGTYVCNLVYYLGLNHVFQSKRNGFCQLIHFPYLDGSILSLEEALHLLHGITHELVQSIKGN